MLTLDCRLLPCPQPIVQCKRTLAGHCPKEIQVLVDNKPAVENVTRFLEKHDYQVTAINKEDNTYALIGKLSPMENEQGYSPAAPVAHVAHVAPVTNSDANSHVASNSAASLLEGTDLASTESLQGDYKEYLTALAHGESDNKTIVLLTSDYIGQGDDVLGEKLMQSFLSCLKEMHLWQIIMLNGGVRLTVKSGKALESLKELEANGVQILVCGACLSHYGIYEKKQIGETTNMLDIVTALDLADKVIRP